MRATLTTLLVLLGIAVVAVYSSFFIVHQTQQAMVLDFGKPSRVIKEPGLNWLIPFVQSVVLFDKRNINLDAAPKEILLGDQKRIVVDTFARYKIVDPLLYFQSVRNELGAEQRLNQAIDASMRRVMGEVSLIDVVRDKRQALMDVIQSQMDNEAKSLGVEIIDVRIKRADVPEQNREAIYASMRAARQKEAAEIRAKGEEQSRRIKATADRQVVVTKAEASRRLRDHARRGRCRAQPHLCRSVQPRPGLLQFLSLDAGLRAELEVRRHAHGAVARFRLLPLLLQPERGAAQGRGHTHRNGPPPWAIWQRRLVSCW